MSRRPMAYITEQDAVRVEEVVITRIQRRGDGITDPVRLVTQVWTRDGLFLADNQPCCACNCAGDDT